MPTLKELVAGDKQVKFEAYRKGNLHYTTDCGFEFIVPIEDCGDGVFLNVDRAMFFMRECHALGDLQVALGPQIEDARRGPLALLDAVGVSSDFSEGEDHVALRLNFQVQFF